jgi:hypothetical protein
MNIANLPGSIFLNIYLKFSSDFMNSKALLKDSLTKKSLPCNLIRV